jgi:hypothetical protein
MSLTRKTVFGCKSQTVAGTPVVPAATDFMIIDPSFSIKGATEQIARDFLRTSVSMLPHVTGKRLFDITVKTELKYSGAPGVALAPLETLLKASSFFPTVVASTSVAYDPSSAIVSGFDGIATPMTCEIYVDGPTTGLKLIAKDALVASWRLSDDAGKYGTLEFTIRALWHAAPTDAAFPTTTFIGTKPQIQQNATITIGGDAVCTNNLEIGCDLDVTELTCASSPFGLKSLATTGRKCTAKADPIILAVATHDFFDQYMSGATMVLSAAWTIENNATAQKITITAPLAQYSSVGIGDRGGLRTIPVDLVLAASESPGDDELKLKFESA